MKTYLVSLINAFVLILLGLWGYFGSETPSFTALIPVAIGIILLLLNWGLRKENRAIAHIVVILTFLTLVALIKPMAGAFNRSDTLAIIRVGFMFITTLVALVYFVKSFRDARENRKDQETIR